MASDTNMGHMPCHLLRLPPELILRVSSHLSTVELGSMRRSCKQIEKQTFESFAREFFTKRQFMLEAYSLQTFMDIANHPNLARYLTYVIIAAQGSSGWPAALHGFRTGSKDALACVWSGEARDMLEEAFSALPNLKTVGIRDYSGPGRLRDGSSAVWRSYGWSAGRSNDELVTRHGNPLVRFQSDLSPACSSTTFSLVLAALGRVNATPESIEVILRRSSLEPGSFNMLNGRMGTPVRMMLSHLKSIFLVVGLPLLERIVHGSGVDIASMPDILLPFKRFLHALSALESLRLNMDPHDRALGGWLLAWLGKSAPHDMISPPPDNLSEIPSVRLAHLQSLELGMFHVSGGDLVDVLTKFQLRHFSLWKICLRDSCRSKPRTEEDSWTVFLRQLADRLALGNRIESMLIGEMSLGPIAAAYHERVQVQWVPEGTDPEKKAEAARGASIRYRSRYGTSAVDWLKRKAECVYVIDNPRHAEDSTFDDDEDEDDDDDEDDEDDDE